MFYSGFRQKLLLLYTRIFTLTIYFLWCVCNFKPLLPLLTQCDFPGARPGVCIWIPPEVPFRILLKFYARLCSKFLPENSHENPSKSFPGVYHGISLEILPGQRFRENLWMAKNLVEPLGEIPRGTSRRFKEIQGVSGDFRGCLEGFTGSLVSFMGMQVVFYRRSRRFSQFHGDFK